jgi:3-oxoacyl-[acyl-carrier protein] reductase
MNDERTALVTGASRGIGRAIAVRLSEDGFKVLAPARTQLDLLSRRSINAWLGGLTEPVDVIVNNAGINPLAASTDITDRDFDDTLQVNLTGPLCILRGLIPQMKQRRYGRIVNISSIWSVIAKPMRLSYSVSKSGINALTRSLAVELAPFDVLVNAVAPGYVNTDLTRQNNPPHELEAIARSIPIQRLAEPAEIAELVAFLCSRRNTYITGQIILIDGGYSCQ